VSIMRIPFRTRTVLLAALLLALCATPAFAQPAGPALPAWDQLTPAQREQLIAPLRERWNNADAPQRQRMLAHAQRWQQLTPEQRRRAHHGVQRWQHMDPAQREQMQALFASIRPLPREQQREILRQWRQMTPEQKQAWLKAHPAPPASRAPAQAPDTPRR